MGEKYYDLGGSAEKLKKTTIKIQSLGSRLRMALYKERELAVNEGTGLGGEKKKESKNCYKGEVFHQGEAGIQMKRVTKAEKGLRKRGRVRHDV